MEGGGIMTLNQDYQEIAAALGNYFDGFYDGDVEKLRKIFHPNCHLYTATTGSLADADIETIYGRVSDRENRQNSSQGQRLFPGNPGLKS
jgi:hypothetical protein